VRAFWGCACAALATALGGCTAAGTSSVTASGTTLRIYLSAPANGSAIAGDVIDAERLALQQTGSQIGRFTVQVVTVSGRPSDNARSAIEDTSTVAYLGEVAPGASAGSMGILNAQDVLQVSPTDPVPEPDSAYESYSTYGRTLARVVPTTTQEGRAQVSEMQSLGVRALYLRDDGSAYGSAIRSAVASAAAAAGITITGSLASADAIFYGGISPSAAAAAFGAATQSNGRIKLFGSSGVDDPALASSLRSPGGGLYVAAPGFLAKDLPAAGQAFPRQFQQAYGHAPVSQAIFGYEAMAAVLAVLREAGNSANNRGTLVREFFGIRNRQSVLGTYSIDQYGDSSVAPFVFSRLSHGTLVPYKFVQG